MKMLVALLVLGVAAEQAPRRMLRDALKVR